MATKKRRPNATNVMTDAITAKPTTAIEI